MSVSTAPGPRQTRVFLVDNHDSFTGSLVQYLRALGATVEVSRASLPLSPFDLLVLSPGPGRPEQHPLMAAVLAPEVPTFGVCLGHQALALAAGGRVGPARTIVHGRTSRVLHRGTGVFAGLPSPLRATRYHSLAVFDLPPTVEVTALTRDGEVMGLRHRVHPWEGVQFHPESVRSEAGMELLRNALAIGR